MNLLLAAFSFALALSLALYLCPRIIRTALRYGIVDEPGGELKTHRDPVPYLGGLVIFLAFLVGLSLGAEFDKRVLAILLCAALVVSVGLVDDLGTLLPRDKFIGQLIAAVILVRAGVHIELEAWPSPVGEVITVLWLLTCMNAFNIVDVSDGLATSAATLGACGVGVLAYFEGNTLLLAFAVALVGACLGFLVFNREPARIYLGDTGSMLIGTLLGAMTMLSRYSDENFLAPFFAPMALLAIPLFDLTLVIVARLAARRPVYFGSPDHFAVRLRDHGYRARTIGRAASLWGALFVVGGVLSTRLSLMWASLLIACFVLLGLALLGWVLWRYPARTSPRFEGPAVKDEAVPTSASTSSPAVPQR